MKPHVTRVLQIARNLLLCIILVRVTGFSQDSAQITKLLSTVGYGVPSSPAFELLPEKPDEVTHALTPRDLLLNTSNIFNGWRLRTGFAFDGRPFSYCVGSLKDYRSSLMKQILWRSVASVGTAPANEANKDVFLSAGLRLPVIDYGDPRAIKEYISKLESAYIQGLSEPVQPPFNTSEDTFIQRSLNATKRSESIRDSLSKATWNALKIDAGVAVMWRAMNGRLDSLTYNRWGLWAAAALPLSNIGQVTFSGKFSWISADSANQETSRNIAGARARFFLTEWLAGSIEIARVWSNYNKQPDLDETWNHFAVFAEVRLSENLGWIGVVYGGDTSRREKPDAKFALTYAVYTDRILKK